MRTIRLNIYAVKKVNKYAQVAAKLDITKSVVGQLNHFFTVCGIL